MPTFRQLARLVVDTAARPQSTVQIARELNLPTSSVNAALRDLQVWGVVVGVLVDGERRWEPRATYSSRETIDALPVWADRAVG